jgi:hypothetical protein
LRSARHEPASSRSRRRREERSIAGDAAVDEERAGTSRVVADLFGTATTDDRRRRYRRRGEDRTRMLVADATQRDFGLAELTRMVVRPRILQHGRGWEERETKNTTTTTMMICRCRSSSVGGGRLKIGNGHKIRSSRWLGARADRLPSGLHVLLFLTPRTTAGRIQF